MKKLVLLLWAIVSAAHATPPDMIALSERVIGYSKTQVFILREAGANLGLHIYGMHDVFLVAKSIKTGLDEDIWPVYRVHSAYEAELQTRIFALEGAVNPFEIMAARAAQTVGYEMVAPESSTAPNAAFYAEYLEIGDVRLPTEDIDAQLKQAIALTAEAIQPYPEDGYASMSFATPQALLANPAYDIQQCEINGIMQLSRYPEPDVDMARLSCDDDGDRLYFSLVVIISADPFW